MIRVATESGVAHLAPAMSCADLVTALYFRIMNHDPREKENPERDRFILSAGHKCLVQYTALFMAGYFKTQMLNTFCQFGSPLAGHSTAKVPGVEISTGSLGHGLPLGIGMALAIKRGKYPSRVFVLLGDGELAEGSNWEAALVASHYQLDNLVGIIDNNGLCADGKTNDILNLSPLAAKFASFGWEVREINGHSMAEIVSILEKLPLIKGKPSMIIATTVKGYGVSFMENQVDWHYKVPSQEQAVQAIKELDNARKSPSGDGGKAE